MGFDARKELHAAIDRAKAPPHYSVNPPCYSDKLIASGNYPHTHYCDEVTAALQRAYDAGLQRAAEIASERAKEWADECNKFKPRTQGGFRTAARAVEAAELSLIFERLAERKGTGSPGSTEGTP